MKCHEVDYEVIGNSMQLVEITLDPGETVIAEAGALSYMDSDINFEARLGDGSQPDQGFFEKLFSAGKRLMTGESLFLTHFTNEGANRQKAAFAAPFPGTVVPIDMNDAGGTVICQKDAFLCAALGTELGVEFNKRLGSGFFNQEGFILQRVEGDGLVFLHAGGTVVCRQLENETIKADSAALVAFTPGIDYSIDWAGGLKTGLFGGEGLLMATLTGTGTVWMQSLPLPVLVDRIAASLPPSRTENK